MLPIPLIDLVTQYHAIRQEIDEAVRRVLESGHFILGPEVEALEREIAAYCETAFAVAVASGTDALELSLRACGIGSGDEVVTTAYSFFATAEAIVTVGARPVFIDIDPRTYNLDPAQLAAAVTPRTKALVPVHLYGHPCAMDQVMAIAKAHHLKVIEDCAQAIGARYRGQRVSSFGDSGALSFYPSKNLGAYGDGGMVVTNDRSVADQVRLLRTHGSRDKYLHAILGKNSRLDELQAAILRVKLHHIEQWNEARRRNAAIYTALLSREQIRGLMLPVEQPECHHVYHLYPIRIAERDRVQQALREQGVATQVHYPATLPSQPALKPWVPSGSWCPRAVEVSRQVLSLPMYPELTPELIERVVRSLVRAVSMLSPAGLKPLDFP